MPLCAIVKEEAFAGTSRLSAAFVTALSSIADRLGGQAPDTHAVRTVSTVPRFPEYSVTDAYSSLSFLKT